MGEADLRQNRSHRLLRPWQVFLQASKLWFRHDCVDLSAAFAYHAMQSLFPIVLIALSLAARVLGQDEGLVERVLSGARQVLPGSAMPAVTAGLNAFLRQGVGAGLLGVLVLVLTASNAYLTLQRGADRLWWDRPFGLEGLPWLQLVLRYCRLRLKALGLMALMALVIVLDRVATSWRLPGSPALVELFPRIFPRVLDLQRPFSSGLDLLSTLGFSLLAALLLLWMLPSRRVSWRNLLPGAAFLASAFTLLNLLLGRVLVVLGVRFQAYGLVGGVLVFGLWVWMIGVLIYYSQCLSVVLSRPGRAPVDPRS
ncbi:YihY/virulence factor BrkB family protein [Cyanobium sp. NIES-981]|uniref:YihY/virulence factor BrkB family protein n=1 Tax=Cyanobium sp. NIES-981 TaxID=1851505 RepID=UPI0007DCC85C|nr:YihY/virulence factor BrkB family protein [Cyanobium sp. NIES-981]SBO44778.1 YihY family protein [Cyanobium sp. NIES-981]